MFFTLQRSPLQRSETLLILQGTANSFYSKVTLSPSVAYMGSQGFGGLNVSIFCTQTHAGSGQFNPMDSTGLLLRQA